MEARFGAKRAVLNISKLLHPIPSASTRATRACLSTSYEPPQGGAGRHYQPLKTGEGPPPPQKGNSTAEDTVKDGVKKTVEMTENVADSAKETLDGAWKAAKDTAKVVKDSVTISDDDYNRANEEYNKAVDEVKSIDELRAKAGGYDKAPSSN